MERAHAEVVSGVYDIGVVAAGGIAILCLEEKVTVESSSKKTQYRTKLVEVAKVTLVKFGDVWSYHFVVATTVASATPG